MTHSSELVQHEGKRVTFCITELDIGGAEKALVRIAIGLAERGWQVRVVSLRDDGPLAQPLREAGIEVAALRCGGFLDLRCIFRLRRELTDHPADLLMCFLHQANIYGRIAAWFAGTRVAVSGVRVADRRLAVKIPERLTQHLATHYVAVSHSVGDVHRTLCGIDPERMSTIYNGVDVGADPRRPATPNGDLPRRPREILFVGRLTEQKDPLLLLAAYQHLPENVRATTQLTFVGDGPLRGELERRVQQLSLTEFVSIAGQCDDVVQRMQNATVLVLPSRWEGMPNVVLEAMACGLPVMASAVDGTQEVIEHGQTGWLFEGRRPETLADQMETLLDDEEARAAIAANARAKVHSEFAWATSIDAYERLFQRLLQSDLAQR